MEEQPPGVAKTRIFSPAMMPKTKSHVKTKFFNCVRVPHLVKDSSKNPGVFVSG